MAGPESLEIASEADIVLARSVARESAKTIGFGAIDQSRIATAVSELTRNVIRYATNSRGRVEIRSLDEPKIGIEIVVQDDGPGIDDLDLVMKDGYTSARGMGLGLPGTKRLMDEMTIDSAVGRGTTIMVRKWRR